MSASFMGSMLSGENPREAWEAYRRLLLDDPQQRNVIYQFAATEGGRALLEDSRNAWRARGFDAPFDFVFDEEERA